MSLVPIILASVLLSAFFSGLEAAYVSADKIRLEFDIQTGSFFALPLRMITRRPGSFFTTLLLGYYLNLIIFCVASAHLMEPFFESWLVSPWLIPLIETLISALIFLMIGEFFPQVFFRLNPNSLLIFFSYPLAFFFLIFYPFTRIIRFLISLLMKFPLLRKEGRIVDRRRIFTMIDLDHFMKNEKEGKFLPEEKEEKEVILFRNALDFSKVKLHEIMVPRNEIAVLDVDSDIETLRRKFVETGYSRILFYEGNKDNIVGYVHSSAIFQKAKTIKPFLKNVLIVPETMTAHKLLSKFIKEHRSIALVVDEFGGTAGLVTSEDILEEIFGEIEDEYDTIDFTGKKINDRQYVFSGRIEIDTLNENYHLNLPESEYYETLAGFILFHQESMPQVNSVLRIGKLSFKILKATLTKIELLHLTVLEN